MDGSVCVYFVVLISLPIPIETPRCINWYRFMLRFIVCLGEGASVIVLLLVIIVNFLFQMKFGISLSISVKATLYFGYDCTEFVFCSTVDVFTILSLPIPESYNVI